MKLVCLDMENVIWPEIWPEVAKATNVPELSKTSIHSRVCTTVFIMKFFVKRRLLKMEKQFGRKLDIGIQALSERL